MEYDSLMLLSVLLLIVKIKILKTVSSAVIAVNQIKVVKLLATDSYVGNRMQERSSHL